MATKHAPERPEPEAEADYSEPKDTEPEAYPLDANGDPPAGAFLEGYRSALDNPAHPLHHLKDA
jgi:hypothetical protein